MSLHFRSVLGFVSDVDQHAMSANQPVSAMTALIVRSNVQHCVDMSAQYRVSWCASTGSSEYGAGAEFSDSRNASQYSWDFAPNITDSTRLPSFDLAIGGRLVGTLSSADVTATIKSVKNNSVVYTTDMGGAWTSTTAAWRYDPFAISEAHVTAWRSHKTSLAYTAKEDSGPVFLNTTPPSFAMLRLEITVRESDSATGTGMWQLCGVQLREWFGG